MKQEPIAWEATSDGVIKFVTDSRYKKFDPKIQRYYKPYRCSHCKEPVKQEPVAWMKLNDAGYEITMAESDLRHLQPIEIQKSWSNATPLYAAPVDAKAIRAEAFIQAAAIVLNSPSREAAVDELERRAK